MAVDLSDKTYHQRRLASRQRRQQAATRQQSMAVDRGAFRVKSEEGLEVGTAEDPTGSQVVYGTLTILGTLAGNGTVAWQGTIDQIGPTFLRGPVHITGEDGTLTVDAETLLQGLTRLLEDLQVEAGGRIIVGDMIIDPADGGKVTFPNDAVVQADGLGGIQMRQGANKVFVGPGLVSMQYGSRSILLTGSGITVTGMDEIPLSLAPSGAFVGAVGRDSGGQLYEVVA